MKRIISFSLWGSNRGYCIGAVRNAERAPKFYPGWVCRFYCDPLVPETYRKQLLDLGCEIVDKPKSDDFLGLYWRFEPMYDDGEAERFIVRDTDSLINAREADAVSEWVESGLPFHVMRDNPSHNVAVMGGMWGARCGMVPHFQLIMSKWIEAIPADTRNPRGRYHGSDQIFLEHYLWAYMERAHLAHIGCESVRRTPYDQPFRVALKRDGYVGMVYSMDDADRCEALEEPPVAGGAA